MLRKDVIKHSTCVYCMKALRDSKVKVTWLSHFCNFQIGPGIPLDHLVLMPTEARAAQIIGN